MFQRKGQVLVELSTEQIVLEELVDMALAAGADDFDVVELGNDARALKASNFATQKKSNTIAHADIVGDSSLANLMHWQNYQLH